MTRIDPLKCCPLCCQTRRGPEATRHPICHSKTEFICQYCGRLETAESLPIPRATRGSTVGAAPLDLQMVHRSLSQDRQSRFPVKAVGNGKQESRYGDAGVGGDCGGSFFSCLLLLDVIAIPAMPAPTTAAPTATPVPVPNEAKPNCVCESAADTSAGDQIYGTPGHFQQRLSLVRSPSGHSGERSILVPCPAWVNVTRHKQRPRLWPSSVHLSRSPATPTTLMP